MSADSSRPRALGPANAAIKTEWAELLGAHLVKRTYSEPHWSRKRAAWMARERVTLSAFRWSQTGS